MSTDTYMVHMHTWYNVLIWYRIAWSPKARHRTCWQTFSLWRHNQMARQIVAQLWRHNEMMSKSHMESFMCWIWRKVNYVILVRVVDTCYSWQFSIHVILAIQDHIQWNLYRLIVTPPHPPAYLMSWVGIFMLPPSPFKDWTYCFEHVA